MALTENQRVAVLLEILGGPKFVGQMRAASAETRRLALATRLAGREAQLASKRSFIMQQGLFTLRRYAFYGTLAIGAMTAAVGRLGYEYLSAMQQASVALRPVIKDQTTLNGYLDQLFQISKYSPFVITDLALSFRQLYAGLHPLGIEGPQIITMMQALTDFMSFSGKTGPGQMQRLTLALQHMAYAGRLTGYAVNQLGRLGLPVNAILKSMGVVGTDSSRIARLNIPAQDFIAAMEKYAKNTPGIRNAARRMSMGTFHGLMQVARDTLSQLSGGILNSAYGGGQSLLGRLFRPGGPFDVAGQIATRKKGERGGGAAIKYLSAQFTGTTGLGQGVILLTNILKNLGRVFVTIVIPAFVLALHILILFWPTLKLLNILLGFAARNASWLKFVFAALAAEFVLTHSALMIFFLAQKIWTVFTFGQTITGIKRMIFWMKMLRTVELAGLISRWKAYAFALELATVGSGRIYGAGMKNNSMFAKMSRVLFTSIIPAMTMLPGKIATTAKSWAKYLFVQEQTRSATGAFAGKLPRWRILMNRMTVAIQAAAVASWEFTASILANPITWIVAAVIALTVGVVILYYKWKRFHDLVDKSWKSFKNQSIAVQLALSMAFGPIIQAAVAMRYIVTHFHSIAHFFGFGRGTSGTRTATGAYSPFGTAPRRGHAAGGWVGVGERGPEIAHLPLGTRITPAQSVKSVLNTGQLASGDGMTLYSTIVMPNGKVLAEVVSKARTDKEATR